MELKLPEPRAIAEPVEAANTLTIQPASRLFTNSLAMGGANLVIRGLGYLNIIFLARRLDARYVGTYALLVTASMLVDLVSSLGLDKLLIREIASNPISYGKGYFRAALSIRFATAVLSASGAWILLLLFFKNQLLASPISSAIFLTAIFPIVAARNCEAFLTAHERLLPVAASQVSERLVGLGAVLLLFFGALGFAGFLCAAPLAALARLGIVAWFTGKLWQPKVASRRPHMPGMIRRATELFSVEILALVYFRSDVFLLAKIGGLRETGVYQITYKIFECCLSLFTGFIQAVFPRLVRDRSRRSLQAMLAAGTGLLAIPVVIIILGRRLILGGIKPEYLAGSTSLVWLMLTVPLVYINTMVANAAIAANRVRILIWTASVLIAANVGLNLILIPRWSINGAAFSTFACEIFSSAILLPLVWKRLAGSTE